MTYRVIQCFSGAVGKTNIRRAANDPRVEIVGLLVHHADKEGRDAGELAGIAPNGVIATRDLDSLLAAGADCAIWSSAWDEKVVAHILRSAANVYSGMHSYYLGREPDFEVLQAACEEGGTTLTAGGNVPGLISDVAPLFLSGYSGQITEVRAWQRNHVADLPSEEDLVVGVGFGLPPDDERWGYSDKLWEDGLRQSAHMVTDALRVTLEDFVLTSKEVRPAPEDLFLEASGVTIKKGSAAGIRRQFTGHVNGTPFYQISAEITVAWNWDPGGVRPLNSRTGESKSTGRPTSWLRSPCPFQ